MLDAVLESVACEPETSSDRTFAQTKADSAWRRANVNADRTVFEAIAQALWSTGHAALGKLDIEIEGGVVVLWGKVPSYYQKQLAQEVAQQVHGAGRVANGIEVICRRDREPSRNGD